MDKQRYMISDAAAIVSVESHVLRYWEDELELTIPRNEMGHRYYTKENIDEFQKIKELKEQGYQLKAIKMILHNQDPTLLDMQEQNYGQAERMDRQNTYEQQTGSKAAGYASAGSAQAGRGQTATAQAGYKAAGYASAGNASSGRSQAVSAQTEQIGYEVRPIHVIDKFEAAENGLQQQARLDQFQEMMTQIVRDAIVDNNRMLGKEVGEEVGVRVIKEMNYLMREQDEQAEERYRRLDEAIRSAHKKKTKEKSSRLFGKKQELKPKQA